MAYTVVKYSENMGNKRVVGMKITADAATGAIETGLKVIEFASNCPTSVNSSNFHVALNSNASGVATPGTIAVTGLTSGDEMYLTVYGR